MAAVHLCTTSHDATAPQSLSQGDGDSTNPSHTQHKWPLGKTPCKAPAKSPWLTGGKAALMSLQFLSLALSHGYLK